MILGSQSKGRQKILEQMGYEFEIMPANINEKAIRFSDPVALTLALSRAKSNTLLSKVKEASILITSDQVVICNGKIFEKEKVAKSYFKSYEKYAAETVTSVVVVNSATHQSAEGTDIAKIWFLPIPENIVDEYIATRDPFVRAGGFDHQHPLLIPYISRIEGELESISGLPKRLTQELISRVK